MIEIIRESLGINNNLIWDILGVTFQTLLFMLLMSLPLIVAIAIISTLKEKEKELDFDKIRKSLERSYSR